MSTPTTSLQSVAEAAAKALNELFYGTLSLETIAHVQAKLVSEFAPLLAQLEQRVRELERQLVMANDAANKGDRARDIADAQEQVISELRTSLQIEREAGSALRTRCAELGKECLELETDRYHGDDDEKRFLRTRIAELEAERENWRMSSVCRELNAKVKELEQDKADLDWLEQHLQRVSEVGNPQMDGTRWVGQHRDETRQHIRFRGPTLRAAIRNARTKENI